ncbi:MAG: TIGR01777 family oxidoreductase [Bacteroidota bacterium]
MAKILISGGSGLIGKALINKLTEDGHDVSILTRQPLKNNAVKSYFWDIEHFKIDENAFDGIEHIVHLAGCGIADKKWTHVRKKEIIDSRIKSAKLILSILNKRNIKLKSFIGASAVGIYGTRTSQTIFQESDFSTEDFLSQTCLAWENVYSKFDYFTEKKVILRLGVVISKNGGALKKLLPIFQLGLGSAIGSGKQYMPWIHLDDLVSLILESLFNRIYRGTYNAVASEHITNLFFSKQLAMALNKVFIMPAVPSFILKIIFGERADMLLRGSRVSNKKILENYFVFKYPDIKSALLMM